MVPQEAYIARLYRVGRFTVYRVNGDWIRSNIDPDFTNFAHHLSKKYVPDNEFWVDQERVPGDTPFYVTNMLVHHRMMGHGIPFGVALDKANKVEHRERIKHDHTQPIVHPYPVTDLFLYDLGTARDCAVKLINGDAYRRDWRPNFTEGGNDLVYPELPPKTIIIDNDIALTERQPTILHESTERPLMEQGMPYSLAHQFALQAEWDWRHRQISKTAQHKLSRRMTFRSLQISVETDKGEKRHWYDPHNKEHGTTTMKCPYGYIRRTEGVDGDHVDCYVGPNEEAKNVYIIHQMKAPDFKKFDEDKCMLGFDSLEDAKKAYLAHYNDNRFLGSVTAMPFDEFKTKVLKTFDQPKKIAMTNKLGFFGLFRRGAQQAAQKALRTTPTAAKTTGPAVERMFASGTPLPSPSFTSGPAAGRMDAMTRARQAGSDAAVRDLGIQGPWG